MVICGRGLMLESDNDRITPHYKQVSNIHPTLKTGFSVNCFWTTTLNYEVPRLLILSNIHREQAAKK